MKRAALLVAFATLLVLLVQCAPGPAPAPAQTSPAAPAKAAWQAEWDNAVQAARTEGKVVIYGNLNADEKDNVAKLMQSKYGVTIELLTGKAAEIAQKTIAERNAGVYIPDINMSGVQGSVLLLKPSGATDTLDKTIILPEVLDTSVWLGNRLGWTDNEHTQIQFIAEVFPGITVNTQMVGANDIKVYKDLLDPKWKGKLVMSDPTTPGAGSDWFSKMAIALGPDYMRALAKQEPLLSRDDRLSVEWVARGKYPIGVALQSAQIWKFIGEGAPINVVEAEVSSLSPQHGCVTLMKNAPHPNAARVFINWLLTKEGQTAFVQGALAPSRRLDVPTTGVSAAAIPKPGKKYMEDDTNTLAQRNQMAALAKDVFASLLQAQ